MAGLLRASEEGLRIVNLARRNPGWNKTSELWCQAALTSQATLKRFWRRQPIRRETFIDICKAVGIDNWEDIVDRDIESSKSLLDKAIADLPAPGDPDRTFDLPDNLPPVRNWVGRHQELETLKSLILDRPQDSGIEKIPLTAVSLVGLTGIGKTTLASQFVRELQRENTRFVAIAWESLNSVINGATPFDRTINSLLLKLSNQEPSDRQPLEEDYLKKTEKLIQLLKQKPCLLLFDQVETILIPEVAEKAGYFAENYREYAWLFKQILATEHQSKVIFISRESFAELSPTVSREVALKGLDAEAAIALLQSFNLTDSASEQLELVERYQGHPKALELVAALIRDDDEFRGNVGKFLQDRDWLLTVEIESFIEQQMSRLSDLERICLTRISVYEAPDYPLSCGAIQAQMPEINMYELKEKVIRALKRRQLLYYNSNLNSFYLHPLFQEKAAILLKQNPENFRSAHRQAYGYFSRKLNFSETPLNLNFLEEQTLEYLKTILRSHYHASAAEDRETAQQLIAQFAHILQSCPPQFKSTIQDYLDHSNFVGDNLPLPILTEGEAIEENQETGFLR